jgi:tRNA U55 pseudouridine synthase TruB
MAALRRLAIGGFCVDEAVRMDRLSPEVIHERLLPPTMALGQMPQVVIDEQEATRLSRGQSITNRWQVGGAEIAATDSAGRLAAIMKASAAMHLQPEKCFGANYG